MDRVNENLHRVFESFVVIQVCFGFSYLTDTSDKLLAKTRKYEVTEVGVVKCSYTDDLVFCLVCNITTHNLIACTQM